jgi:hypothetical protein
VRPDSAPDAPEDVVAGRREAVLQASLDEPAEPSEPPPRSIYEASPQADVDRLLARMPASHRPTEASIAVSEDWSSIRADLSEFLTQSNVPALDLRRSKEMLWGQKYLLDRPLGLDQLEEHLGRPLTELERDELDELDRPLREQLAPVVKGPLLDSYLTMIHQVDRDELFTAVPGVSNGAVYRARGENWQEPVYSQFSTFRGWLVIVEVLPGEAPAYESAWNQAYGLLQQRAQAAGDYIASLD